MKTEKEIKKRLKEVRKKINQYYREGSDRSLNFSEGKEEALGWVLENSEDKEDEN